MLEGDYVSELVVPRAMAPLALRGLQRISARRAALAGNAKLDIQAFTRGFSTEVVRIDSRGLTEDAFARWDGREPVMLTHVAPELGSAAAIDGSTSSSAWDTWHSRLKERHGGKQLGYRRRLPDGTSESCWCFLADFLKMVKSQREPEPGLIAMEELILTGDPSVWPPTLPSVLEEDFFQDYFPEELRPPKYCLVLGTSLARSALHTDPFGWTGWNLCLHGKKRWRFVLPGSETERALYVAQASSSSPPTNLVAHGESPVDLFASEGGPDLSRFPLAAGAKVVREVVQHAGEAIVFPAFWWHQTLHLTPTIAVASQHLNRHNARRVLDDLARRAGIGETSIDNGWQELAWGDQIQALCKALAANGWVRRAH